MPTQLRQEVKLLTTISPGGRDRWCWIGRGSRVSSFRPARTWSMLGEGDDRVLLYDQRNDRTVRVTGVTTFTLNSPSPAELSGDSENLIALSAAPPLACGVRWSVVSRARMRWTSEAGTGVTMSFSRKTGAVRSAPLKKSLFFVRNRPGVSESPFKKNGPRRGQTVGAVWGRAARGPNSRSTRVSLAACESSIKTFCCPELDPLFPGDVASFS